MIKRINNENSKTESIAGTVQAVNENGIKVNDRWFNFSKFLESKPQLEVNDNVEFLASKNFIMKFINISKPQNPEIQETPETLLLQALRSAVTIASTLENEVSIKFSTQDIIKLALTLFIQKSS